ncbi:MAG: signal peptidase I [Gemmatimonadota bacterium]|nr:signal peptidase I [Gemmatimonadota bacterium]MDH5803540.1 signal peptidase I [Gemmatimonadota bacterium]
MDKLEVVKNGHTEGVRKKPQAKPVQSLLEWIKAFAVALVIWFFLTRFFVQAFHIPSGSMEGTLLVGDFLFVNKSLYGAEIPLVHKRLPAFREPQRKDIVVFDSPEDERLSVVKRVLGVPGDTVAMRESRIIVNGDTLNEPYVRSYGDFDQSDPRMREWQSQYYVGGDVARYRPTLKNWGPLVVPVDSFLVLGDNRDDSYDGRFWGFLGRDRIRGRPMFVYFSFDRSSGRPMPFFSAVRWGRLFTRPR